MQFGCGNHKFDNALKTLGASLKSVWESHPEWTAPALLPNLHEKSRIDKGEEPEGVARGALSAAFLTALLLFLPACLYNINVYHPIDH